MAVALVTTLYGSLIANWLWRPSTASKLSVNNNEMMMKEITVEGILSIQAGENPRVIEEKLKSFLSPSAREETAEGSVGGAGIVARRKEDPPKGSPAWMNTFADLMNLLLCFFVMLFSMSSVNEKKFEKVIAFSRVHSAYSREAEHRSARVN